MQRNVKTIAACAATLLFGCSGEKSHQISSSDLTPGTIKSLEPPRSIPMEPPASSTTTVVDHDVTEVTVELGEIGNEVVQTGTDSEIVVDGGVRSECVARVSIVKAPNGIHLYPSVASDLENLENISSTVHLDVDTGGSTSQNLTSEGLNDPIVVGQVAESVLDTAHQGCTLWTRDILPRLGD